MGRAVLDHIPEPCHVGPMSHHTKTQYNPTIQAVSSTTCYYLSDNGTTHDGLDWAILHVICHFVTSCPKPLLQEIELIIVNDLNIIDHV